MSQQCPSVCRCPSGTEVRCINKDLIAIPPNIPQTVQKLYLDGNRIAEINNSHIAALPNLKELYIPRNDLKTVPGQTFANLPNLEILSLASNNISFVDNDAFQNSPKLKYIFLNKNSLVEVPTGLERLDNLQILALDENNIRIVNAIFFSSLGFIIRIELNNNPWSCDCHLRGFKEWMSETTLEISLRENVTCASPEHLIGRSIDNVDVADMACTTHRTTDSTAAKVTTPTIGVSVHSTRTTIAYSSQSIHGKTSSGTSDTTPVLSTQNHLTTGSKENQITLGMNASSTKPFIAPKSTSYHRTVRPSSSGYHDDRLIWIVCVLGAVLLVILFLVLLIFLWYKFRPPPDPRPAIHLEDNVGYRPDEEDPGGRIPNVENKPVTEAQLQTLASKLGHEWEQLNFELGFSDAQLYQFKCNHPGNVRQAIFEMLNTWRREKRREATIGRLAEHLKNIPVDEENYRFLLS
ncbi:leucine-rich repeat-containing protein 70-like [Branchiostoma floridae]|uniref:Leucine-rich repeat-containing protein 70-like n=1 Tax=Branchiostoma floridae TaxID=7739 RepID=A0A9J7HSZ1_BRAFL|nr:leucine-rich repeat-containing protein 70-like [Branchiostoma floridae]